MTDSDRYYWQLLNDAKNDPNIIGVIRIKGRNRYDVDYNYLSRLMADDLLKGQTVFILAYKDDQNIIDNWIWWITNVWGIDVTIIVSTQNNKFRGWKLTKKQ